MCILAQGYNKETHKSMLKNSQPSGTGYPIGPCP